MAAHTNSVRVLHVLRNGTLVSGSDDRTIKVQTTPTLLLLDMHEE
jgi:hypothetical protein